MIEKFVDFISEWLIQCEVIKREEKELYSYAAQSAVTSTLSILITIGFGIICGCVVDSIMIIIPYMTMRKFCGGYHTKKLGTCLICSILLILSCIQISCHINFNWVMVLITVLAFVSLIVFSPIEHENKPLEMEEVNLYRKIVVILIVGFSVIEGVLLGLGHTHYVVNVSIGLILSSVLQLPCVIKQYFVK